ncbi:hypothetical protein [Bosea sp. 2RAB26]|uniref:hypothetical protein n=1 Tax=Bosea sp. 2RAB26 TaxID=3237476 RepID=UPI003F933E06
MMDLPGNKKPAGQRLAGHGSLRDGVIDQVRVVVAGEPRHAAQAQRVDVAR